MNTNQRIVFVNNLCMYMEMRGISQSDIVDALGVSASTVSDWVKGKKYPRVDVMQRLADYLGVLISDLTTERPADISVSDDPLEKELINLYRRLNHTGREHLLLQARYLSDDPNMTKDGASNGATA